MTPKPGLPTPRRAKPQAKSNPASSKRHPPANNPGEETILLAVVGMSPAIPTETIWALAHDPEEPVIPSRVIVVTTTAGREQVAQLFTASPVLKDLSPWDALRQALEHAGHDLAGKLRFGLTGDDVRIITAPDPATARTRELPDIRTRADNEAAADFLLDQVRGVVENPDARLVASIAGGRKTMGALVYACMTLAGRETDVLTHVLVSEPFEALRDFWFPGQPGGPLADRAGAKHDPKRAQVELARVPFVPLRNLFVRELGRKAGTFSRLVEQCREDIRTRAGETIRLEVESSRPEIRVNGQVLRLSPREHLLMLLLARRAKAGEPPLPSGYHALEPLNQLRQELNRQARANDFSDWRHPESLKMVFDPKSTDDQDVRRALSDLRRKLRDLGGEPAQLATCLPTKGRFSLEVKPPLIFLK